ncbi:OmpA family protein [Bradyrhizobium sp. CCGUVB1N3]|uniref:OmpA family protein n=1 Tax=Bradyrhizobium sp. CCGUVB1N3 TaxID=2949629 RepID=UPI0020B36595|nr:OmpA family protein [Bradyrhizobium sp. CCGUVB1N3]MCP3473403.1 OmpA family protein [Bradyrhizobium sp. CCGUVB1N3]
MTHYKRKPLPIDAQKSTLWAVSALASVGVGVGVASAGLGMFDLVNRQTGRAHRMAMKGGGAGVSLPVSASFSASPYGYFKTSREVNFHDFNGIWVEVGELNLAVYAWNKVTFRDGASPTSPVLGTTKMDGRTWALPGAGKQHGITEIMFSDGKPVGDVDIEININLKQKEDVRTKAQFSAQIGYKVPSDALFDFDRDNLKQTAVWALQDAGDWIRTFKDTGGKVQITGHTDSIGSPEYNMGLSLRRARAVANWFIAEKYCTAADVIVIGKGETKPIEPNTRPDGKDNPYGREKNRRVEIVVLT